MLVKTGFYAMELLTAPPGYLAHMDSDGSMLSLRYYEGLIALCKGIQNSLGFWIPRRGFHIPGAGFQHLSVGWLGFLIPLSCEIPDSLSCIPAVQKQKFPGLLNPDFVTLGEDNYKEFEKMNNKLKVKAHILHVTCFTIQFAVRYVINVCEMIWLWTIFKAKPILVKQLKDITASLASLFCHKLIPRSVILRRNGSNLNVLNGLQPTNLTKATQL